MAEADAEPTWRSYMTCVEDAPPASIFLGIEIPQNADDTHSVVSVQRWRH